MIQLHRRAYSGLFLAGILAAAPLFAQSPAPPPQPAPQQPSQPEPSQQEPATPHGTVLYQSHDDTPAAANQTTLPASAPEQPAPPADTPQLTDADRAAIHITRYDLDVRIAPATSQLTGRAKLTVRNESDHPLARIALQISSSLTWHSATIEASDGHPSQQLPITQHLLDTDADHTGRSSELILTPPTPLAAAAELTLETFYTGTIAASGGRLERLGASPAQALATDWDAIAPDSTALRGFGNVLWFPVAAPQLFLSDGTLVPAVAQDRRNHAAVPVTLRLSIDYNGEAPTAAYFCGRRQKFTPLSDSPDAPIAYGSGIATAVFPTEPIGIRPLSLFVIADPETPFAPVPPPVSSVSSSQPAPGPTGAPMLAVETTDTRALPLLTQTTERVAPLLVEWLGPHPLSALTILDHTGQPFEDGPLLVAPVATLAASASAPLLAHSLTHAWVQSGQPWMDEGLADFFSLLWVEREKGRDAAIAQLDAQMQPVAAADTLAPPPSPESSDTDATSSTSAAASETVGQPLILAYDELFFRRKAAAVWWMLRDIVGEQPLQLALSVWRTQPVSHASPSAQAEAFEALLEKTSGKNLSWFFNDWVLHDRGLPSLSIIDVTPRLLPAGTGHGKGWLVAVTVHNAGTATAEVPLVVHAGTLSVTRRILIPGLANTTERVVLESAPTEVVVNDGSTPESGPSTHTRTIVLRSDQ